MRNVVVVLSLGLVLCLVGAGFAATPLYVPGLAMMLMAAAAALWVHAAARDAMVVRSLATNAVEEQAPLSVTVTVRRARVPLPGGAVRAWPEAGVRSAPGHDEGVVRTAARFPRRGRHQLGPASLEVLDPLGLHRRTIFSGVDELLVLPRIEPVRLLDIDGGPAALSSRVASASESGATEVDSLRPHRAGSPASRIHWPTVARTAALMERRLVEDGERAPLVVVDPRNPSSDAALDMAVRAAASLCVHLARHGGCALLLPGDRRATRINGELSGFAEAHAKLAMLDRGAGPPPMGGLTAATVVLWVSAAPGAISLVGSLHAPVRYLVSPDTQPGWPVQFTVAGCGGQRIDRLAPVQSP